jgi:hypothetical protein
MRKLYFLPLVLSLILAIPAVGQDRNNDDEVVN